MKRTLWALSLAAVSAAAVAAQQAQEITFYSNEGYSGARYTVTGPRTILDLPFEPRSAALQGGGSWEICPARDYAGTCQQISENSRNLRVWAIRSIRPAAASASSGWRELARLNVRDRADRDQVSVRSNELFREVKLCAERNPIRIRRAEVQLGNGTWQRMFVPLVITPGDCSNAVDLIGDARRIRALRFEYEAWSPGIARGTIVVQALPNVERQPR